MRAQEMRALAEDARDPMVRAMMLQMAGDYECFAEIADDRAGGSIMFQLAEMPPERRPDAQEPDSLADHQEGIAQAG
jgi:hypothetical protein